MDNGRYGTSALQGYLRVIWRRKWVVALMLVLVPVSVVAFTERQTRLYQASAQDVVVQSQVSSKLGGQTTKTDPSRWLATEATLAQSAPVAQLALYAQNPTFAQYLKNQLQPTATLSPGLPPAQFLTDPKHKGQLLPNPALKGFAPISGAQLLAESSVSPNTAADLLVFQVTDRSSARATALANAYAAAFVTYRNQADAQLFASLNLGLVKSIKTVAKQLSKALTAQSQGGGSSTAVSLAQQELDKLTGKQSDLTAQQQQQLGQNHVVQPASGASLVQPIVSRAVAVGVILGIVLGLALASLAEALDTRPRSASAITDQLELELLGRVTTPPRRLRRTKGIAMLDRDAAMHAEGYRKTRTNLEFANAERAARSIVITSSVEGEGKTTTIVNLAAAFARTGRRVALVDLDLRKPQVHAFFGLDLSPGLTDILTSHSTVEAALHRIDVGSDKSLKYARNGDGPTAGSLEVLTSGPIYPDPDQLLASHALQALIATLTERFDLVLIDSPPMLPVSDVMTLSASVDALVLIVRAGRVKRQMLADVRGLLEASPATPLGLVLTAADSAEGYGYGGYSTYGYGTALPAPITESPHLTRDG
jgi:polysaccharide biosynthesis transport protein